MSKVLDYESKRISKGLKLRMERQELKEDIDRLELVYSSMISLHNVCDPHISPIMDDLLTQTRSLRRRLSDVLVKIRKLEEE
ncbi:hypothetical protein LP083-1_020 [Listeria phage LP-083-1]|uniref:Uncharacterized protein n=1 Tax=Listeria phage LP-083-1 TaxID=1458854 RepID=A0A059T869_9CAUD|nr:hypothetical protein LP083-1_020 [Listeria phage LP-083-1]